MLGLSRNGKTKIYKSTYRAGNITQWFCRAITLCIISVKVYAAIMAKVIFEIKSSLNKVKKFYRPPGWHFLGWSYRTVKYWNWTSWKISSKILNNSRTNRLLARTYFEVHTGVSHFSVIKSKWYWLLVTTRQPCLKHQDLFSCYITTYRNVIESYRHDFGILEFLFVFTRLFPADWLFIIDHTIWLRWRISDQFLWTCLCWFPLATMDTPNTFPTLA